MAVPDLAVHALLPFVGQRRPQARNADRHQHGSEHRQRARRTGSATGARRIEPAALDIARRTLSEEQFGAVWLHYAESMPAREVGEVMGRSWVWVKTTLHRSRRKLAASLVNSREYAFITRDLQPETTG